MKLINTLLTILFISLLSAPSWSAAAGFDEFTEAQYKKILAKAIPMAEQGDAIAQCGGDKEKQKSIYVELRTKELSKG
jgi:ATP-dependent exoDNAse (exonuclease V) alpha subunit